MPGAGSFATPLGAMPIDTFGFAAIADLPFISTRPDAHAQEHSLEVHVPFLQRALPQATLVPLLVCDAPPSAVAQVIQRLWADAGTIFVISTYPSHFHSYDQACGAAPVNGALLLTQQRSLRITPRALSIQ